MALYWLEAELYQNPTNINGTPTDKTLQEIVDASGGVLFFEYEDSEEYYTNVCSESIFTLDSTEANLVGGVHSPQRPK